MSRLEGLAHLSGMRLRSLVLLVALVAAPAVVHAQAELWVPPPPPPPPAPVYAPPAYAPSPPMYVPPAVLPQAAPLGELPRDDAPSRRARWELIAPGVLALVGGYFGWFVTTVAWNGVNNDCSTTSWGLFPSCTFNGRGPDGGDIARSLVPLVGAWWSVADSATMRGLDLAVPVLAGVAQAAGVVLTIVGLATPVSRDVSLGASADAGGARAALTVRFGA